MVTPIPSVPAAVAALLLLPALSAAQTPPADIVPVVSGVEPSLGSPDFREKAPSLPEVFGSLRHDFQRLASRDHVWIAAVGASGAFGGHMFDHYIAGTGWGSGTAREIFAPGAFAGGAIVQSSAALGTYALGRAFDQPRMARIGGELIRAQIVAQTMTQTIKMTAQRTRPDGSMLSFPSGHTSAAFATATVLHRELGWKTGAPAYAVASWVAASRMHAERHYLSDVIMGATIGLLAGRSVTIGTQDARFSISPIAVRGGAGVSIVRVK
jgi:hypothetical protein